VRLKELSVQGYKSFATKHRFVFPAGVTAVVGPNGSGKSNIADAIRWVLGEQRSTHLRARRTDDMIFAGTERRPRAGLAEVSITLDNTDGWLGVDFSEVRISRRAHRDGSIEYSVNGARVLLRDVLDLLGARLGGGTYTVIGQGLVDSALSLRPEERRGLIDEAAGIVPLQRRRDRSLRQLEETAVNLTRVKDILAETGPRLRRMERLAERADKYDALAAEIGTALATWYGFQWRRAAEALDTQSAAVVRLEAESAAVQAELAAGEAALEANRSGTDVLAERIASLRRQRDQLVAGAAAASEGSAVSQARLEGLADRQAEREAAAEAAEVEAAALAARLADQESELAALELAKAAAEAELVAARSALAAAEGEREAAAQSAEAARRDALRCEAELGALRSRLAQLEEEAAGRRTLAEHLSAEAVGLIAEGNDAETAVIRAVAALEAAQAHVQEIETAAQAAEIELEQTTGDLRKARDAEARARTDLESLQARAHTLEALFAGEAESAASRAVRDAEGAAAFGTVSRLLEVVPEWEAAVAAALGARLHGVVLNDSAAVDRAVERLTAGVRGQVTLVPVDGPRPPILPVAPGILHATDVCSCPSAPDIVTRLLGQVAFVEDLASARAAVAAPNGLVGAATRGGQFVLREGVVIAGAPGAEILSLERERRALPANLERAAAKLRGAGEEVDQLTTRIASMEAALGDLAQARTLAEESRRSASDAADTAQAAADRAKREAEWREEARRRAADDAANLAAKAAEAAVAAADLEAAAANFQEAVEASAAGLAAVDLDAPRTAVQVVAESAATAAAAAAAGRTVVETARRDLAAAQAAAQTHRADAARFAAERVALEVQSIELATTAQARYAERDAVDAEITPDEVALQTAMRGLREQSALLDAGRRKASAADARLAEERISVARAESRVERLSEQMMADAEWLPFLTDLPAGVAPGDVLPAVPEEPEPDLDARVAALRRELRAVGAIDREALASFRETTERHESLVAQQADLEAAETDLREALTTLEGEMAARFDITFAAVAHEFALMFPKLFGGGDAELVAVGDDGPGIDIQARPPGKRRQPLAALSGGERALTGVALVFALLKASGTPFVVLDEVDAALDEANINRFRDALADLAAGTQVIIVTHNRGTVQTADTVYGVSMAEDGASQVVSLRVEELIGAD
jgi:chromosome segregation protein